MTKSKFIYCKTVDYMSRMALEKDDFGRFTVIWEFLITGNWVEARVASRVKIGLLTSRLVQYIYIHIYIYFFFFFLFGELLSTLSGVNIESRKGLSANHIQVPFIFLHIELGKIAFFHIQTFNLIFFLKNVAFYFFIEKETPTELIMRINRRKQS